MTVAETWYKAGPAGIVKLTAQLDGTLPYPIAKLLGTFTVRRIDPAIDLIGIEPLDVIARVPKPGKRLIYVGDHGRPESIYLYEKKKLLLKPPSKITKKTTGPLRLKLYERKSYFEQLKLIPPYGTCPVTRAEVECVWDKKGQRPYLSALNDMKSPWTGRVVAYAATVAQSAGLKASDTWVTFCLAAFGGGISKSQEKWSLGAGLKYRLLYEHCLGDLVSEEMWLRWADGIMYTGLGNWVEIAQANKP